MTAPLPSTPDDVVLRCMRLAVADGRRIDTERWAKTFRRTVDETEEMFASVRAERGRP